MARKKQDENEENIQVTEAEQPDAASHASETVSDTEGTQAASTGGTADEGSTSIVGSIVNVVSSVVETVVEGATSAAKTVASVVTTGDGASETTAKRGNRAQKIGIVTSDKMTKTVVVSVNRQVLHPKYRRYIRRTTKFMAHDEKGATIGDKVRIIETRPLSARKRWRVIEIIQKAAK
jgi:small subunit ribosomal protein S17